MSHALIAPSALDLTVKCHGSVKLQASVPKLPDTEEEAEGKAAHWVAMRYAQGHAATLPVGAQFTHEGRMWTVDADMMAGAVMYTNAVGGFNNRLRLESPVRVPQVHEVHCWGTPDAWRMFLDAREAYDVCPPEIPADAFAQGAIRLLRVADYKYGHRYVEVFGNFQLGAGYASGVISHLNLNDLDENLWLELAIIQPRSYHADGPVRWWRIRAHELRPYINRARHAAYAALGDNPECTTNDSCIDCRASHACKTLQYSQGAYIDFSSKAEIVELPPHAIGTQLALVQDAINRLEACEIGLTAQAETLLRQGKAVPHYHMEAGQSRLTYRDDVDVEEMIGLGELLGIDLRKPQTRKDALKTPTQAIQLGITPETMKQYAIRPPAALKLARDNSITAQKVFAK